jgi:hypothetical protein
MAKPALRAREVIAASHADYTVVERHETSIVADVGDGKRALVSQIGAMHYDNSGAWEEIDTTWNPTTGAWQYEMTTAPYQAYARNVLNAGNVVEYRARTGESVTFQPLALNWRDINNSQHQIANPQSVATQVQDDKLLWPNGYGSGKHLSWTAHPTRLQKLLTIDTAGDLIPPANYLGADIHLELTFAFSYSASVTAFIDGVAWNKSSTLTTASHIEFRNAANETLWAFQQPKAWDSAGAETSGTMRVYQSGALHVAVRFPRAFVDAATFPLFMDPTVTVSVAAGDFDGRVNLTLDGDNVLFATETAYRMGSISNNRYQNWTGFALAVPPGATVGTATVTLTAGFTANGDASILDPFDITAEAADDGAGIGEGRSAADLWNAAHTTASVAWNFSTATVAGNTGTTPNIATVVQEIVNRAGWVSGNVLNVRITHPTFVSAYHLIAAFENTTYDPASLYVEYTEGEPVTLTPNGTVSNTQVTTVVATGADDVYRQLGDTLNFTTTSASFRAGYNGDQVAGTYVSSAARFALAVPKDAVILDARLKLVSTFSNSGVPVYTTVAFHAADDSIAITTGTDFDGRTRTTPVIWTIEEEFIAGQTHQSPNLATSLQEVVNRAAWASGNYVNLYWEDAGNTADSPLRRRTARSYNSDPLLAPQLVVTYAGVVDQAGNNTNLHLAVDEGVDTSDGDTTYLVNSGNASGHVWLELSNTPSDFASMNALSIRVRLRKA